MTAKRSRRRFYKQWSGGAR